MKKRNEHYYMENEHSPHLIGRGGVYDGTRIEISDEIAIGRDSRVSHLIIQRNDISRKHCTISYERSSGMYIVTDLSDNGTYINEMPVLIRLTKNVPVRLEPGTLIRLGDKDEIFELG